MERMEEWDKTLAKPIMFNYDVSREDAVRQAREDGYTVIESDERTLLIDIDTEENAKVFDENIRMLREVAGEFDVEEHESFSGPPHKHIIIRTAEVEFSPVERLFFQLLLGSDPVKEYLSYVRYRDGDMYPSIFIERGK